MKKLSLVIPMYNEEAMVSLLLATIEEKLIDVLKGKYEVEIVAINDGSKDKTLELLKNELDKYPELVIVNLSRNFGQHYAITAGLAASTGEWVVVMDCDLQDRPEEIPNLYQKAQEGYDTIFAEIVERDDRFMKKFTSRAFSYVFAYFTDSPVDKKTNNFGIYHRKVIDAVLSMGDYIKCFPVEVRWVGFKIGYHPVIKDARAEGTSGYTWAKLIAFAFDNIIAFSNKPLRMALRMGFYIVGLSIMLALFYMIRYLAGGIAVSGFTTLIISLWLIAGILISLIGIVGIYLGRVFDKVKDRPIFIVKEQINF